MEVYIIMESYAGDPPTIYLVCSDLEYAIKMCKLAKKDNDEYSDYYVRTYNVNESVQTI